MAGASRNFDIFTYTDDTGQAWNKRGLAGAGNFASAVDGHTAKGAHPVWVSSGRRQPRSITYQEPTTFRTVKAVFYTAAAYAAVAIGDIIAVTMPGVAAAVNYSAVKKNPERQPGSATPRQDPQHA